MLYVFISILQVDEELEALLENGEGLSDEKQVVSLCRLMVRVETMEQRLTCVKLIQVGATLKHLVIHYCYFIYRTMMLLHLISHLLCFMCVEYYKFFMPQAVFGSSWSLIVVDIHGRSLRSQKQLW